MPLPDRITSLPGLLRPSEAADAPRVHELVGDIGVAPMTAHARGPDGPGMP